LERLIILWTNEFSIWFEEQNPKEKSIIELRIARIEDNLYFGDLKSLGENLFELRWKNGRRIYFTKIKHQKVLLLIGGFKNAQKKDIKKARTIIQRYARN
jgi:putative addiction module killer protein